MTAERRPRAWTKWIRIAVGVSLLAFLLARIDLGQLSVRWSGLLVVGAIAAVLLLAAAQALSAARWRVLIGAGAPPWGYLFRLYLTAAFFSLFLPTAVGGDAVRATAASRSLGRTSLMVGTVLADRMLGVLALGIFFLIGLTVAGGLEGLALDWRPSRGLVLGALAAIAVLVALGWLLRRFLTKPVAFARGVAAAFVELAREPRRLAAAVALGLLVQLVYVSAWVVLAEALGPLPLGSFLLTVPIVSLSTMAPITISGVGVREGALVLLLAVRHPGRGRPGPEPDLLRQLDGGGGRSAGCGTPPGARPWSGPDPSVLGRRATSPLNGRPTTASNSAFSIALADPAVGRQREEPRGEELRRPERRRGRRRRDDPRSLPARRASSGSPASRPGAETRATRARPPARTPRAPGTGANPGESRRAARPARCPRAPPAPPSNARPRLPGPDSSSSTAPTPCSRTPAANLLSGPIEGGGW
ncbi:MAG: lysylphosphatidylglycerol synthase transmembrane domain-containing protein [Gemmatimonadales bacterium]